MSDTLSGKSILVTGGTGSFGTKFVEMTLKEMNPARVIVLSRDEVKQSEMRARMTDERLRFFLGDIRDPERLRRAFREVDVVIHAAALKQVPTLEYNPFEAVQTNILGSQNVINAALDRNVEKVVALSTDKAVNPVNLYGATKLCAEKLFVDGNAYAGSSRTRFSLVRYGNVLGSRGSVIPLFEEQRKRGTLTITDSRMTRFWLTLDQAVRLVWRALDDMSGGEIFIPKIPSMRVLDLAEAMGRGCRLTQVGARPGEKLHETLISEEESTRALDMEGCYVIRPQYAWTGNERLQRGKKVPDGFFYRSDTNDQWLTVEDLSELAGTPLLKAAV